MTTKELNNEIVARFARYLNRHQFAYHIKKVPSNYIWTCIIGRFDHPGDPYIQGEIRAVDMDTAMRQFRDILMTAISDPKVNYDY